MKPPALSADGLLRSAFGLSDVGGNREGRLYVRESETRDRLTA
jgi:hypothetical protein